MEEGLKFCKFCGEKIPHDAVICTKCGRQVEEIGSKNSQFVINNVASSASSSSSSSSATNNQLGVRYCNKWVSFILCLLLGFFGAHKFYEGKIGLGLVYMFTFGGFLIGWIIDFFNILGKPDPYAVH